MIIISILLELELLGLPPTVNTMYRSAHGGIRYKTGATQQYQQYVSNMLRQAWGERPPYDGPVCLDVKLYTKDKRKWDIDNRVKALQDCLSMGRIIQDDCQIDDLHVQRIRGGRTATCITLKAYENLEIAKLIANAEKE